jgi:hypothetical protein
VKKRMLDPEWFSDDRLAECGPTGFQLFMGLLCLTDKEGKVEDRPAKIQAKIFPYSQKINLHQELCKLSDAGLITRYEADGVSVIIVNAFNQMGLTYNNEKAAGLPEKPAGDQLPTSCLPAGDQLNININNNITTSTSIKKDTTNSPVCELPTELPKNQKPPKVELEKLGSHFQATREQIEALAQEDGEEAFAARVQTINDYCAANGKTYKDYPAAYRNFRKRDQEAKNKPPPFETRAQRNQRILKENHERFKREEETGKRETVIAFLEGLE